MSQSCPVCGAALEEGERFCGECGAYVDWSEVAQADDRAAPVEEAEPVSERSPAMAPPAPQPESPSPPPRPTAPVQVPKVSTAERPDGSVPTGPPPSTPPPSTPPPSTPPPSTPPSSTSPRSGPPPTDGEAGEAATIPDAPASGLPGADWKPPPTPDALRAMAVPVKDAPAARHPGAQQPAPQKPGAPAPRAKRPRPPADDPIQHGDLVCGQCGIGNKPTRKFCRRCGHNLAEAEVAKLSWWRRWRARRKVKAAGTRPRRQRTGGFRPRVPTRLLALLAVLGMLGIGGYALRSYAIDGYAAVRDRIAGTEQVHPTAIEATSNLRGHPAADAHDGVSNEYWAPAKAGDGRGEKLSMEFEEPVRLVYVLITPGVSAEDAELFLTQGRPKEVNAVVRRSDGTVEVKELRLKDELGPARFGIGVSDVTGVTFEIRSSYPGNQPGSHTAVGEVEFQARK